MSVLDKRIVAFTPWGREVTASLLFEYLKRDHEKGILDEWWLCENTDENQQSDREYAQKLEKENDWITIKYYPAGHQVLRPKQQNTGVFYQYMQDPDTIYVRFDDDIVWIEENALERLVTSRIQREGEVNVIFPLIWNNAICSYYLQQGEQMPSFWGRVQSPFCMDPVGWADPEFAIGIHGHLLQMIEEKKVSALFYHHDIVLPFGTQFSVSCFANSGANYKAVGGVLGGEEEYWHTISRPMTLMRPNVILSNSLVSHFSFYNQKARLFETDLLSRYERIAKDL